MFVTETRICYFVFIRATALYSCWAPDPVSGGTSEDTSSRTGVLLLGVKIVNVLEHSFNFLSQILSTVAVLLSLQLIPYTFQLKQWNPCPQIYRMNSKPVSRLLLTSLKMRTIQARGQRTKSGGQDFVLLAKAGLAIPEDQLDHLVEKTITSKKVNFFLIVLTRVMALAPGQYDEQVKRAAKELPGLWMSKGYELGVFWSENHLLMWHSCSMILAQFGIPLPEGWRESIVFYLQEDKIDVGFYEFSLSILLSRTTQSIRLRSR